MQLYSQRTHKELSGTRLCRQLDADESGPRFWTDFLKANLHPRGVFLLPSPWRGPSRGPTALGWGQGAEIMRQRHRCEELIDRVRRFAEECDKLQVSPLYPFSEPQFSYTRGLSGRVGHRHCTD